MTATGHAIIGTVIAAKVADPGLAIPLAIASHFVADAIPHWDIATNRKEKTRGTLILEAFSDVMLGIVLSFLILVIIFPATSPLYAFLMILLSQSPDWLTAPYYFFGIKSFKWAYKLQKIFDKDLDKPWGIISQIALLILIIIIAKVF
ncbi:MAG: hypothetical protein AAB583_04795 [Patescibacteria group bacterium]